MWSLTLILATRASWAQVDAGPPVDPVASLSLEELLELDIDKVYSASRFVQDASRAPAWVTVIGSDEIRRFGYRTLADALQSVVGFYSTYDRNYTYLGVRGFNRPGDYNGRLLVLIDGHRTNDGVYGAVLIGSEFPLDMALVDRIEVIRGPSSSLYGSSAFFAVVNVITKRGRDSRGTEVAFETGSLGTFRGRATVGGHPRAGLDFMASGTAYRTDGQSELYFPEFNSPDTNNGIVNNQDADAFQSLFGKATYRDLTVEAGWVSRNKQVPTAAYDTVFGDPRFETTDSRLFATAQYGRTLGERTQLVGRLFFDAMQYRGDYPYEGLSGAAVIDQSERDRSASRGVGGELLFARRFLGRDNTTVGVEWRDDYRADQSLTVANEPDWARYSETSARTWAVFGQQEFAISRSVLLNAGVRYDHYPMIGGSVNPRLGLIVTPVRSSTVKVLYGTAFRAPSAYEESYWPGQAPLEPETIRTSEIVWEQRLGEHFRTAMSAFHTVINNLISQEQTGGDNDLGFVNAGRATARGLEWMVETRWPHGIMGRFGHTWETVDDGAGVELSNAPRHLTKVAVLVPLGVDRITAGLEGEQVGERLTISGTPTAGFYRQNVTITAPAMLGKLDGRLLFTNVFGARYGDPGSAEHRQVVIPQDGRALLMTLGYRF